ncbi:hypothetical protein AB0A91_16430 [Streptomyces sp. NPDC042207]|uniref:hypothetical protein n=1 Tax=Streptomyces sp. NPDC042207 TaxID=3154331 RepID=UPI0033FFC9B4
MADDINLPNLVSHLAVNLDGLSGSIADARRQGSSMGSALGGGIHRQLDALLRNLPQVQIDGDSEPLDRDLARIHRELARLDSQRIGVDVSVGDALRQLEGLEAHLQRLGDDHHDVNVRAATRQAALQLEQLRLAAQQVDDTDVDVDVHVDTHEDRLHRLRGLLGKLGGMAGSIGGVAAQFGKVAAAVGSAVPAAAGVVSTVANIAPASAVAVTGLFQIGLAVGAVKMATSGMGDALSAAMDPEKAKEFKETLEGLSPEARKFAQAIRNAQPALHKMQQAVQDRFFKGLGKELERTGKTVLPVLRTNLISSAGALNQMAKGAMGAARELASSGTLGKALGSASKGLHNMSGIPGVIVQGLGQIGAAAGPSFDRLTKRAGSGMARLGKRLDKAFESGRMQKVIEHAIDLFGQLMGVVGNVLKIVGQVFNAVPSDGGGLGMLRDVTGEIAKVMGSPEVQSGLRSLFETMGTLGKTLAPLLGQALLALAPVLTALGPPVQTVIKALGAGLQPIIKALGPVLQTAAVAIGQLLVALAPLLPVIGQLIAALLPALTPLLKAVADVFTQAAPVVALLGDSLQQILAPIIAQLPAILAPFVDLMGQLARTLFPLLARLIVTLTPTLVTLSTAFAQLLVAVAPLITIVAQLALSLLQKLMPFLVPLIGLIGKLGEIFSVGLAAILTGIVVPALTVVTQLLSGDFSGAWTTAQGAVSQARDVISRASLELGVVIGRGVGDAITWLKGMPARATLALAGLYGAFVGQASRAGAQLVATVSQKIDEAVAWVKGLPSRARAALGDLSATLFIAGSSLISGFISGIASKFGEVRSKLSALTSQLPDWKGPPKKDATLLTPAGRLLIQGLIRGITATTPSLRATLQKTTKDLAAWAAEGLMKGLDGTTKQMQSALAKLASLAQKAYGTNMASVIAKDQAKLDSLAKQRAALVKRLNHAGGSKRSSILKQISDIDRQRAALNKELATAKGVQKAGTALQKLIAKDTAKLNALAKHRDAVVKKLTTAQKKLDDLVAERKKFAADVKGGILSDADITKGFGDVNSVTAITVGLQTALKKTQQFQADLEKLKKAGIRSDLLQQIAEAGVEGGAATAAALAKATPAELKNINDLQAQLAKSASATGNMVGDALYLAGINAAKGLVAGLKSQEAVIEKQMKKIANAMLAAVKKVHKTKSPSRAFHAIGVMDGEGLRGGLLSMAAKVRDAARRMAGAALDVATAAPQFAVPSGPQLATAYASGQGGGDTYHTWNLSGGDATPGGILSALSWHGLVGRS